MRKPVRIVLRVLGGLIGLVLLVMLGASVVSAMRLKKHYDVAGKAVPSRATRCRWRAARRSRRCMVAAAATR